MKVCACILATAIIFVTCVSYMGFPDFKCCAFVTNNYILSLLLVICTYCLSKKYCCGGEIQTSNKAVLITGCDSGFGNHLAKRLDAKGFHVFASCLFPEGPGADDLRQTSSSRLQVLPLDVTKDESVASALIFVKENLESNDLWAVVNNAGILKGFSTDFSTIQHFKDALDVNALGPVRVTKAFLPLLKKSKGRVINVTSLAGRLPFSDSCAYIMSKYAAVAFTGCLNLEMDAWGVRAISIEPEVFRTPIIDPGNISRGFEDALKAIDGDILSSYGEEYTKKLKNWILLGSKFSCSDISPVIDAMESAIIKQHPNHVYKPSRNWLLLVARYLAESIMPYGLYAKGYLTLNRKIMGYPVPNDDTLDQL